MTNTDLIFAEKKVEQINDVELKAKLKAVYLKNIQLKKLKEAYGWISCTQCGRLTQKINQFALIV